MGYREAAEENAARGCNCCQSVFAALCEDLGMDRDMGLRVSSGLGAGMFRAEVCGALSGALMALGLKVGRFDEDDPESMQAIHQNVVRFTEEFEKQNGSMICRELLKYDHTKEEDFKIIQDNNLFEVVCRKFIGDSAEMAGRYLAELNQEG